jgi:hypothetical protein
MRIFVPGITGPHVPLFHPTSPEDLNMPNDTLGPTLKMKRGNVYKLYANEIEAAYQANAAKMAAAKKN